MSEALVRIEGPENGVAVVWLTRPKVNALSTDLLAAIQAAFEQLEADPDARCVVIAGEGKHFSAGADIGGFVPLSAEKGRNVSETFRASFDQVAGFSGPTIAAVTGYALGGGFELALACDFRFAANTARFGLPEISLGIFPGAGGTQRLARLCGPAKAKDLVFTGRHMTAQEAQMWGVADRVVETDDVVGVAREYAETLATGATAAMAHAKAAIDGGLDGSLADGLSLETEEFGQVFDTKDATIGVTAFIEKSGDPEFTGS